MRRREFLAGAAGFAAVGRCMGDASPALRIGVMTDTHVGTTVESCSRVRMALELFKAKGAELIINNGDIADHFYPTGYVAYRQVSDEVYGADYRPQEIFTYAWHDAYDYKNHPRDQAIAYGQAAFEEVRKLLKAPNGHTATVECKGYTFLVMPQFTGHKGFLSWQEYEDKVAAACRANPGRPVFVVDHVPPRGTVYNSYNWGNATTREVLNKYPQVVDFSGHVHGSLRNDLFIWQKEFTVINSGCLQVWSGLLSANAPESKQSYGVLTVDVHADRLVVRRWDVRDQSEIDPQHPWVVPLPFAAATAPYERGRRRASEPKPRFAADAAIAVKAEGDPFAGFNLSFPDVGGAMQYRIDAQRKGADGAWTTFTWLEVFSEYWKSPKDRTGRIGFLYRAAYFEPDGEYRFAVTPVNQYGVAGEPLFAEAKAPSRFERNTLIFESNDPMSELEFAEIGKVARKLAAHGGFYGPVKSGRHRLMLPEGIFKGPPGTRFRATVDMHTIQADEGSGWSIKFQDPSEPKGASTRVPTPNGDSGDERYVLDLVKKRKNLTGTYCIQFDWGAGGRVRINRVKVERIGD